MHIKKAVDRIPRPTEAGIEKLIAAVIQEHTTPGYLVSAAKLHELVIVAYQNGRYDEACEETRAAVIW